VLALPEVIERRQLRSRSWRTSMGLPAWFKPLLTKTRTPAYVRPQTGLGE
jgi:hypothetical protein